jgi:hypothetical protein
MSWSPSWPATLVAYVVLFALAAPAWLIWDGAERGRVVVRPGGARVEIQRR